MVTACSAVFRISWTTIMVMHMTSRAIQWLTTLADTVTSSKIFSSSKTTMKTFLTLKVTSITWDKTVFGGGNPEVYTATWFYGINITIYSQVYINTDGILIIKADGPQGNTYHVCVMWNMSYTTITTVSNHPGIPPSQFSIWKMSNVTKLIYNRLWMIIKIISPLLLQYCVPMAIPSPPTRSINYVRPPAQ